MTITNLNSPWKEIGTNVKETVSVKEALQMADLDWDVGMDPLYRMQEDGTMQESPAKATYRKDTGDILGIVRGAYNPLQNREAFKIFEPFLEENAITLDTAGCVRGGSKVWMMGKINIDGAEIVPGDKIDPYVLLSNGHDGMTTVRFGFFPVRLVCENMLASVASHDTNRLIKVFHSKNVLEKTVSISKALDLATNGFKKTVDDYRQLTQKTLSPAELEDYVKKVFPSKKKEGEEKKLTRSQMKVIELFESGRGAELDKDKTLWGAYNAVNEFLMYETGKSDDLRMESLWFKKNGKTNQKALETALKLAA